MHDVNDHCARVANEKLQEVLDLLEECDANEEPGLITAYTEAARSLRFLAEESDRPVRVPAQIRRDLAQAASSGTWQCVSCGSQNVDATKTCKDCGWGAIRERRWECEHCKGSNLWSARTCRHCGEHVALRIEHNEPDQVESGHGREESAGPEDAGPESIT